MKRRRPSSGPTNRNLLNHGAGKGSADRSNPAAFAAGMADLERSGVPASQDPAFKREGGKFIKRYGQADVVPFEKLTSKPIIH
jgi:hypothetical protein